ncbi:hypothetical protein IWW55_001095 [Coemansia sp. RSA 2706]|nr:hypothetical protein IWW55_001095 [Coemansia sp. RSA 2706]
MLHAVHPLVLTTHRWAARTARTTWTTWTMWSTGKALWISITHSTQHTHSTHQLIGVSNTTNRSLRRSMRTLGPGWGWRILPLQVLIHIMMQCALPMLQSGRRL